MTVVSEIILLAGCILAQSTKAFREITFITEPAASVRIDGVLYGTADGNGRLTVRTFPGGRHKVSVRADGFAETAKVLLPTQRGSFAIRAEKTADSAELAFQEGERLIATDREAAIAAYKKAIKARPRYPAAYISLARAESTAESSDAALKLIASLRRITGANAEASAVEGRIYKDLGNETKAVASFKRSISEGKGFQPEAHTGLGLLYKEKADDLAGSSDREGAAAAYGLAARELSLAIAQLSGAPDAIVIYQLLGLVYEQQKKYREAISLYEDFLKIFPDAAEAEAVRSFIVQLKKQIAGQGPQ